MGGGWPRSARPDGGARGSGGSDAQVCPQGPHARARQAPPPQAQAPRLPPASPRSMARRAPSASQARMLPAWVRLPQAEE